MLLTVLLSSASLSWQHWLICRYSLLEPHSRTWASI